MADATTATQNDACCSCCVDVQETRLIYRERQARLDQERARLAQIGENALHEANSNSALMNKMFAVQGIATVQPNPVEASSIADLKDATAPGNALAATVVSGLQSLVGTLAALLANIANSTPSSPGSTAQQTGTTVKAA